MPDFVREIEPVAMDSPNSCGLSSYDTFFDEILNLDFFEPDCDAVVDQTFQPRQPEGDATGEDQLHRRTSASLGSLSDRLNARTP